VRTVLSADPLIESRDSEEVCVDFKDVFPPAAPTGVAVLTREAALEISWSPASEEDLALYRVYRASKGAIPEPVAELPATETTVTDKAAPRNSVLFYTVTAVDKAGNESAPSKPVEAQLR
jgi:fibronectin type 3 domain-containing protein